MGEIRIEGLDFQDLMRLATKKSNKFAALALQEIEELGLSENQYKIVRKVILDGFADFRRSLMRAILGDVEVPPYYDDESK